MRSTMLCCAGLFVASLASAAPVTLQHQARLLDANGTPIQGPVTLQLGLYAAGSGGTALWSEAIGTTAENGYVSLLLGSDTATNPLGDELFDGSPRYLGVAIDGTSLGPRQLLATVPSAIVATNQSGGTVSATTATVSGTLRLGTDASTCEDGTPAGTLRWDTASSSLLVCDGALWKTVSISSPGSCAAIKRQDPSSVSDVYTVAPGGGTPLQVYCDMSGPVGRTLLMRIAGSSKQHVTTNSRAGAYPCLPNSTNCRLSTEEISRFIAEEGTQVFEVDPDSASYLSFFQRAASPDQTWPTNLEATQRSVMAGSVATSWVLTQYRSYSDALNAVNGDTGDYDSANHYYPTAYGSEQLFFCGGQNGIRSNTSWSSSGYADNLSGTFWVY